MSTARFALKRRRFNVGVECYTPIEIAPMGMRASSCYGYFAAAATESNLPGESIASCAAYCLAFYFSADVGRKRTKMAMPAGRAP